MSFWPFSKKKDKRSAIVVDGEGKSEDASSKKLSKAASDVEKGGSQGNKKISPPKKKITNKNKNQKKQTNKKSDDLQANGRHKPPQQGIEFSTTNSNSKKTNKRVIDFRDYFVSLAFKDLDIIPFTIELAESIHYTWNQNAIKKTLNICSKWYPMDNTSYFLNKVMQIAAPTYEADFDDYVLSLCFNVHVCFCCKVNYLYTF
ncbi:hypothetical protein RFI_20808 [Reticulomyxa filosa]|uniref:Uncharacterized protein n=1 Tax=Reticulomyxa filosa TaxID=46433 RepID=X6MTU0_RETFI|nr:hypothetical protein RFI_20808 [Reticulomyxa filosa]|eukprot:ETO16535.1 hypothetical protein RFI_20808 [Reticulomyxa filosa]